MLAVNCRRDGWTTWTAGTGLARFWPHGLEDLGEQRALVERAGHVGLAQGPKGAGEGPAFLQVVPDLLELPALDFDLIEKMFDVAPAGELQLLPLNRGQTADRIDTHDRP